MKKYNLQTKIFEYLAIRAGKEIQRNDLSAAFLEDCKKKEREEIKALIEEILWALENDGLVQSLKKTIKIAKPFSITGTISLSKRGDGFVKTPNGGEIFVPAEFTDTSITGDTVEVLPIKVGKKDRLEGEIKTIVKRGRNLYRMKITETEGKFIFGKLLDMSGDLKEAMIPKKSLLQDIASSIKPGDVVIVKLKENVFQEAGLYEVIFIKIETGAPADVDFNRILMKYNFSQIFPDTITLDFPEEVEENTVTDWNARVDLRELYTITIDGATAKDFDDAISFVEEDKKIRFYVHIADVSYYVKQDSNLDEEAYKRSTSVYLADQVVPMLPPELSENLCSLVANKNRLAFTVEMEGDYSGKIFAAKFYKSIIRVNERYTYDKAEQEILANEEGNWICKIMRFTNALKKARIDSGRIDLNFKESYVVTDENRNVLRIQARERLNSHILIEELMLSANIKVAEFLRKNKMPTLYRIHETMDEEKLENLNNFLKLYGFKHTIQSTEYSELKKVLKLIEGHQAEKIFNYFLLRSFMQACYSGEQQGHWGLGFKDYCHFTSPIRRYPDLVCHRALEAVIKTENPPYPKEVITLMGTHTSKEERRAADAERDIMKLKACRFLENSGLKSFTGIITGIKPHSVFVELEDLFVEGVIPYTEFTNETELFLPDEFSFVSKKYSRSYFMGEKLELELDRVDFEEIKIFLKLKK